MCSEHIFHLHPQQFHYYLCHDETYGDVYWMCWNLLSMPTETVPRVLLHARHIIVFSIVIRLKWNFVIYSPFVSRHSCCFKSTQTQMYHSLMSFYAQIFKKRISINHQSVACEHKTDFFQRNQSTVYADKTNERTNEWMFFCVNNFVHWFLLF